MKQAKKYFAIYKPFGTLSQFTDEDGRPGLGRIFNLQKDVYAVGRLDRDSEGLLLLTNDKKLNNSLLNPENEHQRTYWVEVEGTPTVSSLQQMRDGLEINVKGLYTTRPCEVQVIQPEDLPDRDPPVNHKKYTSTTWLEVKLIEGKNRQIRKMTAKIGHPTLRLIRVAIEELSLFPLAPGQLTQISEKILYKKLKISQGE